MTENGETTTYTYNGLNQLTKKTDSDGTTNYSYDLRGNQTEEKGPGLYRKFAYKKYSLTTHNCVWVAIDILKHGNIGSTKQKNLNNILYKYATKSGKRYKVIRTLIPNTADDKVAKIFGTSVKNVI